MLGSRLLRILAAVFVLSAVANLLWPRATGYVSTFAVVNAPLVTVRAPINGVIATPTPAVAQPIAERQILLDVEATFERNTELARLSGDIAAKRAQIEALGAQYRVTEQTLSEMSERAAREAGAEKEHLSQRLAELEALRLRHEVLWDRSAKELERLEQLAERGAVAGQRADEARFLLAEADALLVEDDARIAALRIELEALEAGLPSPTGQGRRGFTLDRRDDLRLRVADLQARHLTAVGELRGLELAQAALQESLMSRRRFQPTAATNGVIWTASRASGATVTLGSDLFQVLDCDRRFLEVIFAESAFDGIPTGTPAEVQLRGSGQTFSARVISRHAAGRGSPASAIDAAVERPIDATGLKVFIGLDPADVSDPEVAAAFCDVGRTAEVRIRDPHLDEMMDGFWQRVGLWAKGGQRVMAAIVDTAQGG